MRSQRLVADMFASMYAADGVGLAANQIGVPLRVFVFDCPTGGTRLRGVVVNPRLEEGGLTTRLLVDDTEGCLSIAGQHAVVPRLEKCDVTGVDESGQPVHITGSGLLARCFQHECDHLDGRLYVDRISQRERRDILNAHASATGVGAESPAAPSSIEIALRYPFSPIDADTITSIRRATSVARPGRTRAYRASVVVMSAWPR